MLFRRIISSITTLALCASFMVPVHTFAAASFTGGTNVSGGLNVQVSITDLQVTGVGAGDTVPVFLYVPAGSLSMTTTTGLTFTGASSGQRLYFSGTLTDVNTALATLKYTHSSAGTFTLEASIIEAGQIYDPSTQHIYEVVNNGSSITATTARSAATARSINGVSGYLANITSSDENSFVAARITQDGWFGASDSGAEGTWQWLDGPEAGTTFWTGTASGTASGYENWAGGEPNQSGDEDCSQFYANGSGWNDLPCGATSISTYIVEYGAPGALPNVAGDTLDITLSADTTTQAPTLTSPTSDSIQNTLQLTYSLPEAPTAGSVTVGFNNGAATILTMGDSQSVDTTINLDNLTSTIGVSSATASSLPDGTYTVTLSYQDYLGNPVSTDVATDVVIDTTVTAPNISSPTAHARIISTTSTASGSCENGSTVSIANNHLSANPTTTTCSSGTFSVSISWLGSANNVSQTLSFTQTDLAGNVSEASTVIVDYATQTGSGGGSKIPNPGCNNPEALNYNPESLHDKSLCKYKEEKIENSDKDEIIAENSANLSMEEIEKDIYPEEILTPAPLECTTPQYTTEAIRLNRKNNAAQVELLEKFLNTHENAGLVVNGIYERKDFDAVIKWQEKYADDVLKPWGLKKGTGYIYTRSLAKIKSISESKCPQNKTEDIPQKTDILNKESGEE